jgi:DNA-binding PadR family transcriptional regulator
MSLKHAVLALVAERRGHGYDLARRFEERVGPGWRLNPSAVYPALDQLERAGLVASASRDGGSRRSPRIVYSATRAGSDALDAWMRTTDAPLEPVRPDLHLKLAFGRAEHRSALVAHLLAGERAAVQLLARYPRADRHGVVAPAGDGWTSAACAFVDDGVAVRLRTDLAWLRRVRAALED